MLKEGAKRGIKVKMLILRRADTDYDNGDSNSNEERIIQDLINEPLIVIQYLGKLSNSKLITIVSDAKLSLTIEVNDDTAKTTNEAIGLATYSNSDSTVLCYISIFNTL